MRSVFTGKYKVTCPECGVAVVTAHLEALVWEHCPGCGRHIWDRYDTMMAEEVRLDIDRRSETGPVIN
jgi:Zn-finger nucleic acid-binding protein